MPRKPMEGEKRESRINIILIPSLYKQIVTLADSQGLSLNEYLTRVIEKTVDKNKNVIEQFQAARQAAKEGYSDAD